MWRNLTCPWYLARITARVTLCVGVFAVHCVSYSIFIKPTSMSSSPLWSLLSQRLAHLVTMLHCLLQEQRLRRTKFTVRTLKSVTCTCIKPEVLLLLLSPSIPLFSPGSWLHLELITRRRLWQTQTGTLVALKWKFKDRKTQGLLSTMTLFWAGTSHNPKMQCGQYFSGELYKWVNDKEPFCMRLF